MIHRPRRCREEHLASKLPKPHGQAEPYFESQFNVRGGNIGSPTQALANQLKPYGEQMTSYVKNADHFIDIPDQQHVESTDMLISFAIHPSTHQ
ncbi:hypothetical protein Trydic_g19543 [Trypoxylus dichotomus]